MIVPNYDGQKIVDEQGYPTPQFYNLLQTLLKNLTQSIGNEGYQIPQLTNAQKTVIQNSFQSVTTPVNQNTQTVTVGAEAGTLIFDKETVNGGSLSTPNGQLYILLGDGTFHAIPNL